MHEAARLQEDLVRAGMQPFAWMVNQNLAVNGFRDPLLVARGRRELPYISEVREKYSRPVALVPWKPEEPVGTESLRDLIDARQLVTD